MARYGLFVDYLERAHAADMFRLRRKRRMLREICDAFDLSDNEFVNIYRLSKPLVRTLVQELEPYLKSPRRKDTINNQTKVLTALAFYASGSYQRVVGEGAHISVSQSTVSNIVREVTLALNTPAIIHKYIKFPRTRDEMDKVKKEFYEECGIPGVVGCIDGTHIAIVRPALNEERFYNRKQYHSLNVQIICDSDLNIMSVDASYPGATNDCTIWQNHPLYSYLLECRDNGEVLWVLGDSGYPQLVHTMTPILNAATGSKERVYTKMHTSARNCVERCIGILKARFRCLLAARTLHYDPHTAARIVNACCVLHNIAHGARLVQPVLTMEEQRHEQQRQLSQVYNEELTCTRGQTNYERSLQDPRNRRVNRTLLAGRAERDALIDRICATASCSSEVNISKQDQLVSISEMPTLASNGDFIGSDEDSSYNPSSSSSDEIEMTSRTVTDVNFKQNDPEPICDENIYVPQKRVRKRFSDP